MNFNLGSFSVEDPVTNLATYSYFTKLSMATNIICQFLLIFKGRLAALQYGFINYFRNSFYKCHTINNAVFFLLQINKTW